MRDIYPVVVILPFILSILLFIIDLLVVLFATPAVRFGEFIVLLNLTAVVYWFFVNLFNRLREVFK